MIYSGLETDLAHETLAMNGPDIKYRDGRRKPHELAGEIDSIVPGGPGCGKLKWKILKTKWICCSEGRLNRAEEHD